MNYFVKPVVCDYGVYWVGDNGERKLIVICNSLSNAEMVAEILNSDDKHEVWSRPTGEWAKVTEAHEDIGYDRGFRDGYAQAVEERTCEWVNDEEGRNHEQRY